ncbi:alpha/beta hydrolase [Oceanicoccus sagamiensis]|uniref:Alpha/beta hydrolase fold-5 domain-containing protein n=1 Tax=Oceanicoccus sagamiensis TaxID=716816 RepID=A0A1X9NBK1_9GAMM|nr:alpha/beta hydrolase [Oceanicoccus sagamiensis]ARN72929.1 hypothetical protein BST96_01695 [Oceanicoccus sagamiensis]
MHIIIKRTLWSLLIAALAMVLVAVSLMVWMGVAKKGIPGPDAVIALAALEDNPAVQADYGELFTLRPTAVAPKAGLIIYPGAHADPRAYVQVMTRIAEAGYLAVATEMPLGYAFLAPDRAEDVYRAYPNIQHWFLAGHSLGGAMAGRYAATHGDKLAGLAFWDAFPPDYNSLADSNVPTIMLYRATLDGEPEEKFKEKQHLFPKATDWVPILGGDHKQFGSGQGGMFKEFGMFIRGMDEQEWEATQWKPMISRDEQQAIIVKAMLAWFEQTLAAQATDQ